MGVVLLLLLSSLSSICHAKVYILTNDSRANEMYSDKLADFGNYPDSNGIEAQLFVANPVNACTPIESHPYYFVLVEESTSQKKCSYETQSRHAQSAGYVAVIIYRRSEGATPTRMNGDGPTIVAVSVTREAGEALKNADYTTGNTIRITANLQIPFQMYLIPFVVVISICFFFMIVFSLGRYCRYRIRQRRSRLSPANLKKIPQKKFKKGDEYDVCAICIEEYEENDKIRILPCNHAYHSKCVDPWLTSGKKLCPVCKQSVEPEKKKKKKKKKQRNNRRGSERSTFDGASTSSRNSNASSADDSNHEDEDFNERSPLLSDAASQLPSSGALNV